MAPYPAFSSIRLPDTTVSVLAVEACAKMPLSASMYTVPADEFTFCKVAHELAPPSEK